MGELEGDGLVVSAAGICSARSGASVMMAVEEPWLGGMLTSAGVGAIDGNYRMRGGIFAEFCDSVAIRYGGYDSLKTGWVSNIMFEPSVGAEILDNMAAAEPCLDVSKGICLENISRAGEYWKLRFIDAGSGRECTVRAKVVIDGTETGDVMKMAGVSCHAGMDSRYVTRESIAPEESNGIVQDMTWVAVLKDYGPDADVTIARPEGYNPDLDRGVQQAANIKTLTRTFSYYVTRGAFGVSRDGKPSIRWIYNSGDTPWTYGRPLPVVDGENTLTPTALYPEQSSDWDVYSAIGGAPVILRDGKICFDYLTTASGKYKTNHELLQNDIFGPSVRPPRTAIGYTAEGNIVLMVVDGRNAGGSQGVTLDELARLMAGVGCTDALNLDGGGSTAMCVTPSAVLLNSPSDGSQRKVMSFVSFVSK